MVYLFLNGNDRSKLRCVLSAVELCKCVYSMSACFYNAVCSVCVCSVCVCTYVCECTHVLSDLCQMNSVLICIPVRQPGRPRRLIPFSFFIFCFLRCSDDTFLSLRAHCGRLGIAEERRRGGQHGADAFLSGDKEPLRHPLFSSPPHSLQLSSAAHQSGVLHMKRAPSLCHAN